MQDLENILSGPSWLVAPRLLGCHLEREIDGQKIVAKIVETEAYDQTDEASHSYHGNTPRTRVMFEPAGYLYVYFSYGMHYCMNVVIGSDGYGSAVLIRAVEPISGQDIVAANRRGLIGPMATNGPGKTTQALAIDKTFNGHDLSAAPLKLILNPALPADEIVQTTRVGISKAVDRPWRFYIKNNPYISKK